MTAPYYVYYLYPPDVGTPPMYVGITRDLTKRLREHVSESRTRGWKCDDRLKNWVNEIVEQGRCPRIEAKAQFETKDEAQRGEREHIERLAAGLDLLNLRKNYRKVSLNGVQVVTGHQLYLFGEDE